MNKAVFLDRDGTINVEKNYLYKIEEFQFLPGVIEGLKKFQSAGYLLIIITNQSGIARGYYTEQDYYKLTEYMLKKFENYGIYITDVLYCPHHPQGSVEHYKKDCNCRKPKLGLFYEASKKWNIDLDNSIAIGDKFRDLEICKNTKCRGFLINSFGIKDTDDVRVVSSISNAAKNVIEK